jgi:hypothetical protein
MMRKFALPLVLVSTAAVADPGACLRGNVTNGPPPRGDWRTTSINDGIQAIEAQLKTESANYNDCLNQWVGLDVNELAAVWGAPVQQTKLPKGEMIYVWQQGNGEKYCRTSIFTKKSKITKWQWGGNTCRRADPP